MDQSFPYYLQRKYYGCTYFALRLVYLMRPCQGGSQVARLNFKTYRVGVYKCLSLIVGFAVTVTIWPRRLSLVAISF